jgi:hypothetical protein
LPLQVWGQARIRLGQQETSVLKAKAVRCKSTRANYAYGFTLADADLPWRTLVGVLQWGSTHADLTRANHFLRD